MRRLPQTAGGLLGLALASIALASPVMAASPRQAAQTFIVMVGYEDLDADGIGVQAFLPEDIATRAGDTVSWRFDTIGPHTVTFLADRERPAQVITLPDGRASFNPEVVLPTGSQGDYRGDTFLNSGFPPLSTSPQGFTYTLTFTEPGTFPYVCLVHPFMTGSVTVLPQDALPAASPEAVRENGETERQGFVEELKDLQWRTGFLPLVRKPDGTVEHRVLAGISTQKADLMRFHRPHITISPGDTVTWSWEMTESPHNVMFLPPGQPNPPFFSIELLGGTGAGLSAEPPGVRPRRGQRVRPWGHP